MDKKKIIIRKVLFNLLEMYTIYITGYHIIGHTNSLFILLLFCFSKMIISMILKGQGLHYKKFHKCALFSFAILVTLYFVCKLNYIQSIFLTIIASYLLTTCANYKEVAKLVDDVLQWSNSSKYQLLIDFMKYNYADIRLINYENYLKANDVLKYNLYDLKFKQHKSMEQINEITGIYDNKKIISNLDSIYETLKYTLCLI